VSIDLRVLVQFGYVGILSRTTPALTLGVLMLSSATVYGGTPSVSAGVAGRNSKLNQYRFATSGFSICCEPGGKQNVVRRRSQIAGRALKLEMQSFFCNSTSKLWLESLGLPCCRKDSVVGQIEIRVHSLFEARSPLERTSLGFTFIFLIDLSRRKMLLRRC
jgi:hypothetical protein